MFAIAFLIGLYANFIFLIGLAGFLKPETLVGFTLTYFFLVIIFWSKFDEKINLREISSELINHFIKNRLWVILICLAVLIMVIGSLAPETAFDATWYHLTLAKLYLGFGDIRYIPGGLFYYSVMPKLVELLYIPALSINGFILAHFIHMSFALLTGLVIYNLTKKFSTPYIALIVILIYFSNIVVLWEATTAYIDLARSFFEVMALWGIINYIEKREKKWLIESAFLFGLAIETKLLALTSLPIFLIVIFFFSFNKWKGKLTDGLIFIILSLIPSFAWFVLALVSTGSPIYPFFSNYDLNLGRDLLAFSGIISDMITIFIASNDPVSPLYLIFAPLLLVIWRKLKREEMMMVLLSGISLVIWTLSPKTGGGRFLLPYLPLFSVTVGIILFKIKSKKMLFKVSLITILVFFGIAVMYRGIAQLKSLPVILGLESKRSYLGKNLNFNYGDFYDIDGKFEELIGPNKKVLLYGFHNLYYMNVPFIDSSYVQKGDRFDYVATQHALLPKRFSYWQPIYYNKITDVTVYTLGQNWIY